jgi:non-ribosomal peptide synthetase component F
MTLLAGFLALLFRNTREEDLAVGTAVAGRGRLETEGLIGLFVNMLVLRADLSGSPTFLGLLDRVREAVTGALAHQDLPFDKLVEHLRPGRDGSQGPLFRIAFGFDNVPGRELELPGLALRPLEMKREAARFDLTLWIIEEGDRLTASWTYSTDLYRPETIERLHSQLDALLRGAVEQPGTRLGRLPLQREGERVSGEEDWDAVRARRTGGRSSRVSAGGTA